MDAVLGSCQKKSPNYLYIAIVTGEVFPPMPAYINVSGVSTITLKSGVKQYLHQLTGSGIIILISTVFFKGLMTKLIYSCVNNSQEHCICSCSSEGIWVQGGWQQA